MKTISYIIALVTVLTVTSCEFVTETEESTVVKGETYIGKIFEIEGDFLKKNDWEIYYTFPKSFKIYETDVVLVYLLWETTKGSNGNNMDVWRLLPQTIMLSDGLLQYNYDYTIEDVKIFLKGTTDFNKLLPAETQDQVFRIAVLPAEFANLKSVNIGDLNSVMKSPLLKLERIEKQVTPLK
jgi:hypothetical protein